MVIYSPLSMGALTGKYKNGYDLPQSRIAQWPERYKKIFVNEAAVTAAIEYENLALDCGLTLIQLAIAWLYHQPVKTILLGASKESHLDDLVSSREIRLNQDTLRKIDELHRRTGDPVLGIK
mgnify:CR=1 FL=1